MPEFVIVYTHYIYYSCGLSHQIKIYSTNILLDIFTLFVLKLAADILKVQNLLKDGLLAS